MATVDTALKNEKDEPRDKPLRIGLIHTKIIGAEIVAAMETAFPGLEVSAIYHRELSKTGVAFDPAGTRNYIAVKHLDDADQAMIAGDRVISSNRRIICRLKALELIVECTGEVEFGAKVTLDAIRHKKHVVLLSSGLHATIGRILKVHADQHGVIVAGTGDDQATLLLDLCRIVKTTGHPPLWADNIKAMLEQLNHYIQRALGEKCRHYPGLATSFADDTKHAIDMAVLANARAALLNDSAITPRRSPFYEVIAVAKKRLEKGTRLDGIGGHACYGIVEDADAAFQQNLLPIGLSPGSTLIRQVIKNQRISFDHVEMPEKSLCHQLWKEQANYFHLEKMAG